MPKRRKTPATIGRFEILNAFVDGTIAGIDNLTDVKVWFILYRDARQHVATTAQSDIARRAGVSDRTVRRSIERLKKAGLIKVARRGGLNAGMSSYIVSPISMAAKSTADT